MAKKELYTVVRYWEEADLSGIDILGHCNNYSDAVKYVEELIVSKPWCDYEFDGDTDTGIIIEDLDDEFEEPLSVRDIFGYALIEGSCKYREDNSLVWTNAYFYILGSEEL